MHPASVSSHMPPLVSKLRSVTVAEDHVANPGQAGAAARMLCHWGGGFLAHLSRYRRLNMSVLLFRRCRRYTSVADSCGYLALNGSAVRST